MSEFPALLTTNKDSVPADGLVADKDFVPADGLVAE